MKYKAIIFDLDGTLIDSMQLWRKVDKDFLHKRGKVVPHDLFDHLPSGNSFIQTAQYFKDRFSLDDSVESIMQEWTDMVTWHYKHDVKLKPGAKRLVEHLAELQIPIGLGTSNSYELSQHVLSQNGIWHHFNAIVTGDMQLMGKPFPDIYLKCAAELNADPADCVVIEDTLTGVQAAKAAGMTAIAIFDPDSIDQHQRIRELADDFVENHHTLSELLDL